MPGTEIKKQKVVNLVKDTGRSKEDIINYLHKLGLDKITVNTTIEIDIVKKVYEHFKRDIEELQKHKAKVVHFAQENKGVSLVEAEQILKEKEAETARLKEQERVRKNIEENKKKEEERIKKQQEIAFREHEEAMKKKIENEKKKEELERIYKTQKAKEEKEKRKQEELEKQRKEKAELKKAPSIRITELPKSHKEESKSSPKSREADKHKIVQKQDKETQKASQEKLFEDKKVDGQKLKSEIEEKPAELSKEETINTQKQDTIDIQSKEAKDTVTKEIVTKVAEVKKEEKKVEISGSKEEKKTGKAETVKTDETTKKHSEIKNKHIQKHSQGSEHTSGKNDKNHGHKQLKHHPGKTEKPYYDKSKHKNERHEKHNFDNKGKQFFKKRPDKRKTEKITLDDKKKERVNITDPKIEPPTPVHFKITNVKSGKDKKKSKADSDFERKKKARIAKEKARIITNKEIDEQIRETIAKMGEESGMSMRAIARKKKKKERLEQEKIQQDLEALKANVIKVTEYLSTVDLANLMKIEASEIIKKCFQLGNLVTINQRLDKDLIQIIADEFGYKIEFQKEYNEDSLEDEPDPEEKLKPRPPVVTVMGHVDHGKTSLLDYIRKANVVAGEAGGITQHIGAYKVKVGNGKEITFLDTPGHEAFTAMRARGGQAADIVVLVVAADDSVMPQTVEAINHALAANVPIVVAINKVDKPDSNSERIRQQLAEKNILVEEWGGNYQSVEISAKFGKNIDVLLEKILLQAELLELKANLDRKARGVVLEAKLDKGRGITATVLVQKGSLKIGSNFVAGLYSGKVRAMFDERDNRIETAVPSTPVMVLGFDGMPQAGDVFIELESESLVRDIALKRQQLKREQDFRQVRRTTLDDISKQIKEGAQVDLNIIIKADTDGSAEAISDSLMKLSTEEAKVNVIHNALGQITESDILLAEASGAIVIGFNVRPNLNARKLAEKNSIDIRLHNIIYKIIDEVKLALEGMLEPELKEEVTCTIEVRQVFKVPKVGNVAGCYVQDGKVTRNTRVRLLREGFVIFEGNISSLKRLKDDVREVDQGYECGIGLENFNDIKPGDIIEGFKLIETKRKLVFENN